MIRVLIHVLRIACPAHIGPASACWGVCYLPGYMLAFPVHLSKVEQIGIPIITRDKQLCLHC